MKLKKFYFIFIVLVINFTDQAGAQIENKIVAKIDNEIITSFDIKNKILTSLILARKEINQKNVNNLKGQVLDSLIQIKLKKIELTKFNYKDDLNQINSYLNSISSNNIEGLKKTFQSNKVNFDTFVDEVKIESKWRKLIYNKYAKKIDIDPKIIDQEIKKILQTKRDIVEYNLSEIDVKLNNDETDKEKILQIKKEISDYGFDNAVIKFSVSSSVSNKGNIGWINGNSLSNQISKVVKKMNIGKVSEPIKRQDSILFIKLNDRKISKSSDIDSNELKNNLIDQKRNELFQLYSRSDLSKLRNTKFIEFYK